MYELSFSMTGLTSWTTAAVIEHGVAREPNHAPCGVGCGMRPRHGVQVSCTIEDVCICGRGGWSKVDMIQNIENLCAELHVESFRNPLDVVVLKQREVE